MRNSVVVSLPEATPQPVRNPTAAQSSSTFACARALRKVEGTTFGELPITFVIASCPFSA